MHTLLLAAGYGMRLRPLTLRYPKPLIPVLNRPLAGFTLLTAKSMGIGQCFMNRHYLRDRFPAPQEWHSLTGVTVTYLDEDDFPYGTGGAIKHLFELHGPDDVLVLNTDGVSLADFSSFLSARNEADAILYVRPNEGQRYRSLDFDPLTGLLDILTSQPTRQKVMFAGVAWLSRRILDRLPSSYPSDWFVDALIPAAREGAVIRGYFDKAPWFDLGNADYFFETTGAMLQSFETEHKGWQRYHSLLEPVFQRLSHGAWGHPDSHVDPGVEITDWCLLGPGCDLGPGTRIMRSILVQNVRLRRIQVTESFLDGDLELEGFDIDHALVFEDVSGLQLMNW